MTTTRFPASGGKPRASAWLALLLLLGTALALAAAAACGGGDDTTTNNYIGATDAEPPRLGPPPDAGSH